MKTPRASRRQFLKTSAAASAVMASPLFVPAASSAADGKKSAGDKIQLACIGTGGKGRNNLARFMQFPDVQVVAVCDVDAKHADMAKTMVNKNYNNSDCKAFTDFRELLEMKGIDAVSIATPDHWHALTSIAAANAGKDIYCEKPLANSVGEGRAICDAVKNNDVILQCGSHERSNHRCRFAAELVRSGRIGKLETIRVMMPTEQQHHLQVKNWKGIPEAQPVPPGFDYDNWLGHTPLAPYHSRRCHFWWRFILAYGGGEMTDRGAHIIDIGQLAGDFDATGPVKFEATGTRNADSLYDAFMDYSFTNTYANGVKLIGECKGPRGIRFEGSDGWIFVHIHGGKLEASRPELLDMSQDLEVELGRVEGDNHHRNFIDCVISRKAPFATAEIGHRTATICHLNNIAMTTGETLEWDPVKEVITNSKAASKLLTPEMRKPWSL